MGAVVVITWNTDEPNHEASIYQVAKQIEGATGEPVNVEIGIIDNRSAPSVIEVGKLVDSERFKIR